ncbi:hypothetical protein GH714_027301 [Hevea brasiliensis]|uniref:Wound-induced protein 1 n=1 Tax=Hevea brasiliensis TaxID=3981 RepID=A0A6A6LWT1_HEVBR|nr:hypothetical protein GH714_027301 [Hevea brasiliensis]
MKNTIQGQNKASGFELCILPIGISLGISQSVGDQSRQIEFRFKPRSIKAIGDRVIVEGWKGLNAYWVHVWSLEDGIVTQFREYFNTWLTVIHRVSEDGDAIRLWQSEPRQRLNRSLPDLVLAI